MVRPAASSKTALRGVEVPFFDVSHEGATHRVQVKRVATARRYTLRVRAASHDVVLTMPVRGSLLRAKTFVDRHAAWIGARLARLPAATPFGVGAVVPVRGVPHIIVHEAARRGTVTVEIRETGPCLCVSGEAPFVGRRVRDWLMRQARLDLTAAVARHAAALGRAPTRLTLRDTTTRWGSCSSAGALNFSWRLIMAPAYVLDYLAAHEVAHLRHMNHSAAYWATLEGLFPQVAAAEAWLKVHGAGLLRYGANERDAS